MLLIIVASVCGILVVASLIIFFVCCRKRQRNRRAAQSQSKPLEQKGHMSMLLRQTRHASSSSTMFEEDNAGQSYVSLEASQSMIVAPELGLGGNANLWRGLMVSTVDDTYETMAELTTTLEETNCRVENYATIDYQSMGKEANGNTTSDGRYQNEAVKYEALDNWDDDKHYIAVDPEADAKDHNMSLEGEPKGPVLRKGSVPSNVEDDDSSLHYTVLHVADGPTPMDEDEGGTFYDQLVVEKRTSSASSLAGALYNRLEAPEPVESENIGRNEGHSTPFSGDDENRSTSAIYENVGAASDDDDGDAPFSEEEDTAIYQNV